MTTPLQHFITLVDNGRHRGCSGGEARARKLAKAMAANLPGLDSKAIAGMKEFIDVANAFPSRVKQMLEEKK